MLFTANVRSLPKSKLKGTLILLIGFVSIILSIIGIEFHYKEPNPCEVPRMLIIDFQLDFESHNSKGGDKYRLYLLREGFDAPYYRGIDDLSNLGGTPVLFLPGNAGSYRQVRSLAARSVVYPEFDWFSADFNEDYSAFHGKTVLDETTFINDAIAYILSLYKFHSNQPSSVIIVSHSMGGIVARALPALDNYVPNSVNTILTLSSPHAFPPLTFDRDIVQLYDLVNQWWRYTDHNISLISVAGGHNDMLVLPDSTFVNSFNGLTLFTHEIDGFRSGVDHLAIMWCQQIVNVLCDTLNEIANHTLPSRTIPMADRYEKFNEAFKRRHHPGNIDMNVDISSKILWGQTFVSKLSNQTNFRFPRRSSLWSYKVISDKPINLKHYTDSEYRVYGDYQLSKPSVNESTVMWYSAAPYVPFKKSVEQLNLEIIPKKPDTLVYIRVAWIATFANIFMHYRSLAASWPFGIVVLSTLTLILTSNTTKKPNQRDMFGTALWTTLIKGFVSLAVVIILLHLALSFKVVRNVARIFQYPSEMANMAALSHFRFDVHDLLLGISDFEFIWIIPLLLAVASTLVITVHYFAVVVLACRRVLGRKLRHTRWGKMRFRVLEGYKYSTKIAIFSSIGACFLYFVPYQLTTVLLTVVLLFLIEDDLGFGLAFTEILIWISIIDAPIFLVWFDNLNLHWLRIFATFKNLEASLPLLIYVAMGTPYPLNSPLLVKWMTMFVFGYIAFYAFMYGSLHAFMLHHLTCYLSIWMLAITYDSSN